MPNNKKAWHIHKLVGKYPDNYSKYAFLYELCENVQSLKKLSTCLLLFERSVYNSANSKDFQMMLVRHRKKAFMALR